MLYDLTSHGAFAHQISAKDAESSGSYNIIIDDRYFFYVQIGSFKISERKVRSVISNYLYATFPQELVKNFAVFNYKGGYIALVYKRELEICIEKYYSLFKKAEALSTCFCELIFRYPSFSFTDGERSYDYTDGSIAMLQSERDDTLRSDGLWGEVTPLKGAIEFEDIKKAPTGMKLYKIPAAILLICYILYISGLLTGYYSDKSTLRLYEGQLERYYIDSDVAASDDPYGMLLLKASKGVRVSFRVSDVLNVLNSAVVEGVAIDSITAGERNVKIEGTADSFSEMESLKLNLQKTYKKGVNIEDSRQNGGKVKFTLRFEP